MKSLKPVIEHEGAPPYWMCPRFGQAMYERNIPENRKCPNTKQQSGPIECKEGCYYLPVTKDTIFTDGSSMSKSQALSKILKQKKKYKNPQEENPEKFDFSTIDRKKSKSSKLKRKPVKCSCKKK